MPTQESSDVTTRLGIVQTVDNSRLTGNPFKLPSSLRADVDADVATLRIADSDFGPAEGARAAAAFARRAALEELSRQLRGGYRHIAALDETTISEGQRLLVFDAYGWESGELGRLDDARVLGLARQAPTVSATDVGSATFLYPPARLGRLATQLAIIEAAESTASGADRELVILRRDAALNLAATTLLRVRFFYSSASRDADATPELTRIGFQPRRDPGTVDHGGPGGESSTSGSSESSGSSDESGSSDSSESLSSESSS